MNNSLIASAQLGETLKDFGSRDSVPGLHLRVKKSGKIYFLLYRTQQGVQRRPKIGVHGVITLTQARDIARAMLLQVAQGKDPSIDRKAKAEGMTIDQLFEACFKDHWSDDNYVRSGWSYEAKRLYTKNIKPRFGDTLVNEVQLADIQGWHETYRKKKPYAGNRALSVFGKMFKYAEQKLGRPQNTNPCALVKAHKEVERDRYATSEEIQKIGEILETYSDKYPAAVAYLYLLIFTGSRPRAIERATWDQLEEIEIEGRQFGILRFDGKTGKEKVVIPPQAMRVISKLPKIPGETIVGIQMPRKLWGKIRKEAGCPDLWARDWRRTFATIGMSGGVEMSTISELLNHKTTQTTKIYAKLMENAKLEVVSGIATTIEKLLTTNIK